MAQKTEVQTRLIGLRRDMRQKAKEMGKHVSLSIDARIDILSKVSSEISITRRSEGALRKRLSRVQGRKMKTLVRQELSVQQEYLIRLLKLRQKIYNSRRYRK